MDLSADRLRPVSRFDPERVLKVLAEGTLGLAGQFAWGSNYTFLTQVTHPDGDLQAVYKPSQGEQPLWDFPDGTLASREVAAYRTSRLLGWDLVPPTVLRDDGPAGPGSLQLFVDADPERHYFTFTPAEKEQLRPAAVFDLLINNADRKGGHVLMAPDGHIWLIDHGVCFHEQDKLRTVIWDFVDQAIPEDLLADLDGFRRRFSRSGPARAELASLLTEAEMDALAWRLDRLLAERRFPPPRPGRPYPWPLV